MMRPWSLGNDFYKTSGRAGQHRAMTPEETKLRRIQILRQRQAYDLDGKIRVSKQLIREFVEHCGGADKVYVSFSGGMDSSAMLHIVRQEYPTVQAVFCNTGLEYPEIVRNALATENCVVVRPKMRFQDVIEKHGFPVISKSVSKYISEMQRGTTSQKLREDRMNHKNKFSIPRKHQWLVNAPFKISDRCCDELKKKPMNIYAKQTGRFPIIGLMTGESRLRLNSYMRNGCNIFSGKSQAGRPLIHWRDTDSKEYCRLNDLPAYEIYERLNVTRTGCVFCMFGCNNEKSPNRFERLKISHPKLHRYAMDRLGLRSVLEYLGLPTGCEPTLYDLLSQPLDGADSTAPRPCLGQGGSPLREHAATPDSIGGAEFTGVKKMRSEADKDVAYRPRPKPAQSWQDEFEEWAKKTETAK